MRGFRRQSGFLFRQQFTDDALKQSAFAFQPFQRLGQGAKNFEIGAVGDQLVHPAQAERNCINRDDGAPSLVGEWIAFLLQVIQIGKAKRNVSRHGKIDELAEVTMKPRMVADMRAGRDAFGKGNFADTEGDYKTTVWVNEAGYRHKKFTVSPV